MASVLTLRTVQRDDIVVAPSIAQHRSGPRIAFLSPSARLGGAERVLLDMIAGLRVADASQRIVVVCTGEGELANELRALGVNVSVHPFPAELASLGDADVRPTRIGFGVAARAVIASPAALRYALGLRSTLREFAPELIHSNGAKMHLLAAIASRGVAPVVWHLHDYVSTRPFMRKALQATVGSCAAIVANSQSVAADARAVLGDRANIHAVLNGVDLTRFTMSGPTVSLDELAGAAPAPVGTVRVGLVGTFAKWKGHELFFRALASIDSTLPIRAYVIGGALYETSGSQYSMDELVRMAHSYGLKDRVVFTGLLADASTAMRSLDIVVHASTTPEPFGLVIAEAMACGRAVITCGTGGSLELVDDERDALSIASGDANGLARAIERLAADASLRARLGTAARATAVRRFDRIRMAQAVTQIHRQAASAARR